MDLFNEIHVLSNAWFIFDSIKYDKNVVPDKNISSFSLCVHSKLIANIKSCAWAEIKQLYVALQALVVWQESCFWALHVLFTSLHNMASRP